MACAIRPRSLRGRQAILKGLVQIRRMWLTIRRLECGFFLGIGVTVARVTLDHLV
jgi:hypothetical protein